MSEQKSFVIYIDYGYGGEPSGEEYDTKQEADSRIFNLRRRHTSDGLYNNCYRFMESKGEYTRESKTIARIIHHATKERCRHFHVVPHNHFYRCSCGHSFIVAGQESGIVCSNCSQYYARRPGAGQSTTDAPFNKEECPEHLKKDAFKR